ncbi:Terminase-like family protein [Limosilactobacillus oris]|nr:Terminase-like family protein [Limosilactobacillus oris]
MDNLLTAKQQWVLRAYMHGDWKYLINYGAVRSGKTFIDNILFLMELQRVSRQAKEEGNRKPMYILAGYSSNSIQNNVLSEFTNVFGLDIHYDRHGHFNLFGVEVVPAYTGNVRGASAIRGMSSYGSYINEASLATQEAFQEIIQRCSKPGARIICDTNPDSPQHYLKKDYIDNKDPKARIKTFHFVLDDNTFLPKDYVDSLKAATPSGMYYDRSILGLWVTGEGAVYKDFDERTMTIKREDLPDNLTYTAGVDWGFDHPTAIMVVGHDDKGNYYLVDESYGQFQQVDPHWIGVAQKFRKKYGVSMPFWCDTARTEHIRNFQQHHINAKYGYKNVLDGVEKVAALIKQHKFYVVEGAAPNFINEIYQYVWDEKTGAPVKDHDHAQDAVRYCIATPLHLEEEKKNHPYNNDRKGILEGMRRLGL